MTWYRVNGFTITFTALAVPFAIASFVICFRICTRRRRALVRSASQAGSMYISHSSLKPHDISGRSKLSKLGNTLMAVLSGYLSVQLLAGTFFATFDWRLSSPQACTIAVRVLVMFYSTFYYMCYLFLAIRCRIAQLSGENCVCQYTRSTSARPCVFCADSR
jgi:hypothetical protein